MNDESHCIWSYWWNWLSSCRQALEEGHEVTVIVRNSEAVNIRNERLKFFQGDVLEPALFSKRIVAQDAVNPHLESIIVRLQPSIRKELKISRKRCGRQEYTD